MISVMLSRERTPAAKLAVSFGVVCCFTVVVGVVGILRLNHIVLRDAVLQERQVLHTKRVQALA